MPYAKKQHVQAAIILAKIVTAFEPEASAKGALENLEEGEPSKEPLEVGLDNFIDNKTN